jgi:hypothetical protein
MGNVISGGSAGPQTPKQALDQWRQICHQANVYHGAGDHKGPKGQGWDIVRHYNGGGASTNKQELIRKIAHIFSKKMGVARVNEADPVTPIPPNASPSAISPKFRTGSARL